MPKQIKEVLICFDLTGKQQGRHCCCDPPILFCTLHSFLNTTCQQIWLPFYCAVFPQQFDVMFKIFFGALHNLILLSAFDQICVNSLFRFVSIHLLLDKIPPLPYQVYVCTRIVPNCDLELVEYSKVAHICCTSFDSTLYTLQHSTVPHCS